MQGKKRFYYEDQGEKCSTTGLVVWGHNHLMQRRQFAFDGQRYFYQSNPSKLFIIVSKSDLPQGVRQQFNR
jgi:hypothetical protein